MEETEDCVGCIEINGICFRADLFNKEQMDLIEDLMDSSYDRGLDHGINQALILKPKYWFNKKQTK